MPPSLQGTVFISYLAQGYKAVDLSEQDSGFKYQVNHVDFGPHNCALGGQRIMSSAWKPETGKLQGPLFICHYFFNMVRRFLVLPDEKCKAELGILCHFSGGIGLNYYF